jgi:GDP-mannose transporter
MAAYEPIGDDENMSDVDVDEAQVTTPNAAMPNEPVHLWKSARVLTIIVLYCIIGSSLSVINKVVVTYIPCPNFILFCQFASTSIMLLMADAAKVIEVEELTRPIAVAFVPLTLSFFLLLLAGMEVMKRAPLETFIAVKSVTPVVFALNEYVFLGRAFPTAKSLLALSGIVIGAVTYVNVDVFSSPAAYAFCAVFITAAVAEGLIAKHTIDKIPLNNWSRSFIINLLSIPLALGLFLSSKEYEDLMNVQFTTKSVILLVSSCVIGLGMSFSTMWIRETLSATSVSVVATCNKFLSEGVNWLIWDKHTTVQGTYAILIIMTCGIFYEQAPLRVEGQGYSREHICPCLPRWMVCAQINAESASKDKTPLLSKKGP